MAFISGVVLGILIGLAVMVAFVYLENVRTLRRTQLVSLYSKSIAINYYESCTIRDPMYNFKHVHGICTKNDQDNAFVSLIPISLVRLP